MSILGFILVAALVGVIAWYLITYVPMPGPIRGLIVLAAVIVLILMLARVLGVDLLGHVR